MITKRMVAEKWALDFEGFILTSSMLADAVGISRRYAKRLLDDFCTVGIVTLGNDNCVATSYLTRVGVAANGEIVYMAAWGKIPF